MATLISYQSSGGQQGRCDAKCYNARHPRCVCICGGRNHGVGLRQAAINTAQEAMEWIEKADVKSATVNKRLIEKELSKVLNHSLPL